MTAPGGAVAAPGAGISRRPLFWVAYAFASAAALALAWLLFPLAIPLVHLDIQLSRAGAVEKAKAVAKELSLVPADARSAVRFGHDQAAQNYIELEGGGKPAFARLVAGGDGYAPFWWEVRLFQPGAVTETVIRFRPDGSRHGFAWRLPETFVPPDPAGLALDAGAARALAEARARADWGVDLSGYTLLEATQQKRTTGRVDHALVYERNEGHLGESRFRLRLGVTGDRLTEVAYFIHVPEAFERRFQALRSANNTLAGVASLSAGVLYGLGGCVFGVLWLLRRHWLVWRPAMVAGSIVGALLAAMVLAAAPTVWFGFDTAQSEALFWARQIGGAMLAALFGSLGYGLVFAAAESLGRRAFPHHPQLWRLWSRNAAATPQVLGRTVGGYLFVPLELALIAAFYYASNRWLGWWQPSESLTDPNILGSAVPALAPIAISLQAGFMEESLFRAVPLALAALVGERHGRRRLAIGIAVIVQALIFGGAHASYPGLPAYSRLVELVLPSILWASIYLRFGLLPTILLHALFDLALFAIPLFLVDAPGAALQRALVVAAALVPLAVVLVQRARAGRWHELAADDYNAGWRPAVAVPEAGALPASREPADRGQWATALQRASPWLGVAGAALWLVGTPFRADAPPLPLERAGALAAADAALRDRGADPARDWTRLSAVKLATEVPEQWLGHKFVWREGGREIYAQRMGNTLAPPLWEVRYARFDGEIPERAEEWRVTVDGDGSVRQVRHTLPEARAGARLDRDAALAIAARELRLRYRLDAAALKLVGAEERQRPARSDWTLLFAEPGVEVGDGGEARVLVTVAGDEVAVSGRYVHVPEAWQRAERERDARVAMMRIAIGVVFALASLAALIAAIRSWLHGRCDGRAIVAVATVSFGSTIAGLANGWPAVAMNLTTAEPVATQASLAVFQTLAGGVVTALLFGLAAGVGARAAALQRPAPLAGPLPAWAAGIAVALTAAGVGVMLEGLAPQLVPRWPRFPLASLAVPIVGAVLQGLAVLTASAVGLFLLDVLARLTDSWQRRRWSVLVVIGAVMTALAMVATPNPIAAAVGGVAAGLVTAILVLGVLRFDYRAVPAFCATAIVLDLVESAPARGTVADWVQVAVAAAVAALVAWAVTHYLGRAHDRANAADRVSCE